VEPQVPRIGERGRTLVAGLPAIMGARAAV